MSKTGVARGGKPTKAPSVASKPSLAKSPSKAASKPSLAKSPSKASSKPSVKKSTSRVSSKPSVKKSTSKVSSKPSAKKSTSRVSSKPSVKKSTSRVSSKPSVKKSTSRVSSKPALSRRPVASRGDRCIYIVCGIISLLSIGTIIGMTLLYINLKEEKSSAEVSMEQLKETLAAALGRPDIKYSSDTHVAEEVKKLPVKIEAAQHVYDEKKRKYKDLFYKTVRSSSNSWKLHGRSLYYFSKGTKTWHDAENFCISRDAHLASVLDEEEQYFITSQLQHPSWIGLIVENKEGPWRWSDGSRLVTQYWSDGKPSNAEVFGESSQECTLMVSSLTDYNWKDENCHKLYGWVCKESI